MCSCLASLCGPVELFSDEASEEDPHRAMLRHCPELKAPRCLTWSIRRKQHVQLIKSARSSMASNQHDPKGTASRSGFSPVASARQALQALGLLSASSTVAGQVQQQSLWTAEQCGQAPEPPVDDQLFLLAIAASNASTAAPGPVERQLLAPAVSKRRDFTCDELATSNNRIAAIFADKFSDKSNQSVRLQRVHKLCEARPEFNSPINRSRVVLASEKLKSVVERLNGSTERLKGTTEKLKGTSLQSVRTRILQHGLHHNEHALKSSRSRSEVCASLNALLDPTGVLLQESEQELVVSDDDDDELGKQATGTGYKVFQLHTTAKSEIGAVREHQVMMGNMDAYFASKQRQTDDWSRKLSAPSV